MGPEVGPGVGSERVQRWVQCGSRGGSSVGPGVNLEANPRGSLVGLFQDPGVDALKRTQDLTRAETNQG